MTPGYYELTIYCGTTFNTQFVYSIDGTPVDLTGATVTAAARNKAGVELFRWSTENGKIAPTGIDGRITITADTAAFQASVTAPGVVKKATTGTAIYTVGTWALEIATALATVRLLHGPLHVSPEVVYA